jgi:hypothetical protein
MFDWRFPSIMTNIQCQIATLHSINVVVYVRLLKNSSHIIAAQLGAAQ